MAEDEDSGLDIFEEPPDYREKEKPFTYEIFRLGDGREIKLRLVGHDPLWGHLIWNAARVLTTHLTKYASTLIQNKTVLELGAGAGLPSILCAILGARRVVVTDYPSPVLIENLRFNIESNSALLPDLTLPNIHAEGFLWGADITPLQSHMKGVETTVADSDGNVRFDVLILADILFNHSQHLALLKTVRQTLARRKEATALVFFTPYRPWLLKKDLNFFELARQDFDNSEDQVTDEHEAKNKNRERLEVRKISETMMESVMFENDPGDEKLRRTVFGYELVWQDLQ